MPPISATMNEQLRYIMKIILDEFFQDENTKIFDGVNNSYINMLNKICSSYYWL